MGLVLDYCFTLPPETPRLNTCLKFCSLSLKLTTTSGFTRLGGLLHRLSSSPRISSAPLSSSQEEKIVVSIDSYH